VTRAFVAVQLPNEVLSAVAERAAGLNIRGGRTTTPDQWHLTLQFLGNDADVNAVGAALDRFSVPGGRVQLGGAGAFPNARRARVLWVGVAEGSEVLARLAREVAERLARIGFEPEARPFRPHLTLVRGASPTDVRAAIAVFGSDPVGPAWNVETLTVFESQLRREGARYLERASVVLPG
jgi:2'-5' RNA ligase